MPSMNELEWIDARIKERASKLRELHLKARNPELPSIDAGKFGQQVTDLAKTLCLKVEREGPSRFTDSAVPVDVSMILRQLMWTYNLIRWINADDTRFGNVGYLHPYSFVCLPLVRTMIDGFYNCTALLADPSKSRTFRISGYYRKREALREDENRYSGDPLWEKDLTVRRQLIQDGMRADGYTHSDLDDKKNKWPLLAQYLDMKPDTPHKQLLKKMTLGFWKEYSSISHASFDGLVDLFPFVATDSLPHDKRDMVRDDVVHRYLAMHFGRTAGILLCLLTEIQHFFSFDGADIDKRLTQIWSAMAPVYEVRELFDFRYKELLKEPLPTEE